MDATLALGIGLWLGAFALFVVVWAHRHPDDERAVALSLAYSMLIAWTPGEKRRRRMAELDAAVAERAALRERVVRAALGEFD